MITVCAITLLLCISGFRASCPPIKLSDIPSGHLFYKKPKPLIIAHRGQPKLFQENSLDGILSAVDAGADGFELDIFLTKDDELVVFHDDNLQRLTGVNKTIWNCTYDELSKMNLKKSLTYGNGKLYHYDKERKIPLLKEVLEKTKKTSLFHFLEIKPSNLPVRDNTELERVQKTGIMTAQLVKSMGLLSKTVVTSFNCFATFAAKRSVPELTIGTLLPNKLLYATKPIVQLIKVQLKNVFPGLGKCMDDAPDEGIDLLKYLVTKGAPFTTMNSSFIDTSIQLFENPMFGNETVTRFRKIYGDDISLGFYTAFKIGSTETQDQQSEAKIKRVVEKGIHRLITDDVKRARKLLGRSSARGLTDTLNTIVIFGCLLVASLMYL